ncbi:hypothetical protein [Rhodoferax aquaticus]|uniref:Uncharacterized protein n=1 Tax=Rhodoferax aquaticus TaxID=2527691 RepID=A0A515EKC9_9BURK|nr:hypothetical protein [Rhodoferax aquaticus]QDL53124.1 hypothetical protein EXZ61_02475 [Rhodoferax aquaticus]
MLAAVETVRAPVFGPLLLVHCRVVIKMPDGSRGEHEGLYPNACDALERALELFPEAVVVCVTAARGRRATT